MYLFLLGVKACTTPLVVTLHSALPLEEMMAHFGEENLEKLVDMMEYLFRYIQPRQK